MLVDDRYSRRFIEYAHEQKAHACMGVWLIGMANKTVFGMLMGLAKRFEA